MRNKKPSSRLNLVLAVLALALQPDYGFHGNLYGTTQDGGGGGGGTVFELTP